MKQYSGKPSAQFEKVLAASCTEDFDGHTEFARLTAAERLEWLYQAATFVYENRGRANVAPPLGETSHRGSGK